MKKIAICLVSGGMDSLVSAAIAHAEGYELAFLHLNYGQKTEKKEEASFHKISDFYAATWQKTINLGFLSQIGGSSLTDSTISVKNYKGDDTAIPDSYVPFRNTHIIALAVSWAEVIGATKIFIGAVEEDSSGYPDCRAEYYRAYNELIRVGTKEGNIEIVTPVIHMKKADIVRKALELKAPLEFTWSCYAEEKQACGVCDSCALRLRGFRQAGVPDPIEYSTRPEWN
jgi:7-cyano-7-deazaguanine synthase